MAKQKIVLIDDHQDTLSSLALGLELRGYEVHTAGDGAAGLDLAQQCQADAMVIDIVMPGMNGFDVARQARARLGPKATLIALSGFGERNNRTACMEAGFDHYLLKPVTVENLIPLIGR